MYFKRATPGAAVGSGRFLAQIEQAEELQQSRGAAVRTGGAAVRRGELLHGEEELLCREEELQCGEEEDIILSLAS